jgi:hypothetical protein
MKYRISSFQLNFAISRVKMIPVKQTNDSDYFPSLRAASRRSRKPDVLASPTAIRAILDELRGALPSLIPKQEKDVISLLHSVKHIGRYSATDTKRGRPSRYQRKDLLLVEAKLKAILQRETQGRIGLRSFVDHYLRILDFPADVLRALTNGQINLFEAEQLSRLTADKLELSAAMAKKQREELLRTHLAIQSSSTRLHLRVNEILNKSKAGVIAIAQKSLAETSPDLLEFDDLDPTHLFFDQLKQIHLALREIEPGDLTDLQLEELLKLGDQLLSYIANVKRKLKKSAQLQI